MAISPRARATAPSSPMAASPDASAAPWYLSPSRQQPSCPPLDAQQSDDGGALGPRFDVGSLGDDEARQEDVLAAVKRKRIKPSKKKHGAKEKPHNHRDGGRCS